MRNCENFDLAYKAQVEQLWIHSQHQQNKYFCTFKVLYLSILTYNYKFLNCLSLNSETVETVPMPSRGSKRYERNPELEVRGVG